MSKEQPHDAPHHAPVGAHYRHKQFLKAKNSHATIVERFQKRVLVQKVLEEHQKKMELREKSEQYAQYRKLLEKVRNPPQNSSPTPVTGGATAPQIISEVDAKTLLEREREGKRRAEAEEYEKLLEARRAAKKAISRLAKYQQQREKYVFHEEHKPLPPPKPRPPRFAHTRRASSSATTQVAPVENKAQRVPKSVQSTKLRTKSPTHNASTSHKASKSASRKAKKRPKQAPDGSLEHASPQLANSPTTNNVQNILDELAHEEAIYEDDENEYTGDAKDSTKAGATDEEHLPAQVDFEEEEDVDKTNVDDVLNDILKEQQGVVSSPVQNLEASEMQALQLSSPIMMGGSSPQDMKRPTETTSGNDANTKANYGAQLFSSVCDAIESMSDVLGNSQNFHTTVYQVDEINSYF